MICENIPSKPRSKNHQDIWIIFNFIEIHAWQTLNHSASDAFSEKNITFTFKLSLDSFHEDTTFRDNQMNAWLLNTSPKLFERPCSQKICIKQIHLKRHLIHRLMSTTDRYMTFYAANNLQWAAMPDSAREIQFTFNGMLPCTAHNQCSRGMI